jgi:hypothetical protein
VMAAEAAKARKREQRRKPTPKPDGERHGGV